MSARMPVVFVSHGAPDALLKAPDAVSCWQKIGQQIEQPKSILVISAHWEARNPTASLADMPETIYDFSGFAPELYRMQYKAKGSPSLAKRVVSLLATANLRAELHPNRGLDHGAWVPLSVMFPQANIPVSQLSLIHNAGPEAHFKLGQILLPLREEGVLIVTSGSITHNFSWLDWRSNGTPQPLPKAEIFSNWVAERLAARDVSALQAYRSAPYGAEAHPSEEHFMPFFAALGAADDNTPLRYRPKFTYGGLSMDAYLWQDLSIGTMN